MGLISAELKKVQSKPTELKIVLLGKTGAGKSASGNTILGRKAFISKKSSRSTTKEICQAESRVGGIKVVVYDTPGFFDIECPDKEIEQTCQEVIEKCKSGLCLYLVVVKIDRFTPEEKSAVNKALQLLDEQQLNQSWILFTRGDELENQTIEEFIDETDDLRTVVKRFENRYHVFSNKDSRNENRVQQLLNKAFPGLQNTSEDGDDDFSDVIRLTENPAHNDELPDGEIVLLEKTSAGESATDVNRLTEHSPHTDNLPERRIVLLGKTGVGKSASGNTILGKKNAFHSEFNLSSVTSECKKEMSVVSKQRVSVIDTPGFYDTEMSQEAVAEEIGKSIYLSRLGVHAFLLVLRLDRVTEQEENVIQAMENALGPGVKDHTIILFTHGEKLKQINMEREKKKNPKLRNLMVKFHGRYHVISNKKRNGVQVKELMGQIDKMLEKNNGKCFTCEMYEAAQRAAEEERIREMDRAAQRAAEEQRIREMDQESQISNKNRPEPEAVGSRETELKTEMAGFLLFLFQNKEMLLKIAKAIMITVGSTTGGPMGAVITAAAVGAVEGAVNAQEGEKLKGAMMGAAGGAAEGALHAVVSIPVEKVLSGVLKETAAGAVRGAVREASAAVWDAPEGSRQGAALKGAGAGAMIGAAGGVIGSAAVAVGPTVGEAARAAGNAVVKAVGRGGGEASRIPEGAGTGFTVNVVMVLNLFRSALGPRSPEN